jgi:nicotinate-nucleotide adenylyltransferase
MLTKLGILGGSFNPIHNGHIELGIKAKEQFDLNKIIVMPNNKPAYKDDGQLIGNRDRVNMINMAIQNLRDFEFSDLELTRGGITYTSDTLEFLSARYPEVRWYFIMGGDSVDSFLEWNRPEVITRLASLIVTTRGDIDKTKVMVDINKIKEKYPWSDIAFEIIDGMDISSSDIRKRVAKGQSISGMVPTQVEEYIKSTGLYSENG